MVFGHLISVKSPWVLGLVALCVSATGCTDRISTADLGPNSTLMPSGEPPELAAGQADVDRYDWLRLAKRVGLRGGTPTQFDRYTRASSGVQRQFVSRTFNGSYPTGGMTSFPMGGQNLSFPGGNLTMPYNSSFPYAAGRGSYPSGAQRWVPGGLNSSYPYSGNTFPFAGNTTRPVGPNVTFGQGQFVMPRGAESRGLPLKSPNVTYGQGFPGFPGGSANSTFPRE